MSTAPAKRLPGRPTLPPEQRTTKPVRSIRLDDARWERLKELGTGWLEKAIDRAKKQGATAGPG
jgi:uncharacterized protein (DUF4415 family)